MLLKLMKLCDHFDYAIIVCAMRFVPCHGCCYRRHNLMWPVFGTGFICAFGVSCMIPYHCTLSLPCHGWYCRRHSHAMPLHI